MILGPVCHFELVRIARRPSAFAQRLGFGLILLGVVGIQFLVISPEVRTWFGEPRRDLSIHELSILGQTLFASLMAAQAALVLGLAPALAADAIASERQRKTLQDLLTTRLSGPSIVLGKAAARLASVGVFVALVLPIASMLTLFGGFSPESLLLGDAVVAATAYFLAGLALLASVLARRPRDAIGAAYALEAAWIFLPMLFEAIAAELPAGWMPVAEAIRAFDRWAWPANPASMVVAANATLGGRPDEMRAWAVWTIGSMSLHGTLLLALAAWQLRPAYRREEIRAGRRARAAGARRRWWPRRPVGDDPIYWKEAFVARSGGSLVKRLGRLSVPALLALAVGATLYYHGDVVGEFLAFGYGYHDWQTYHERNNFNGAVRAAGTAIFGFWMLWLGGIAAASIASEREQDTWFSLLATPLDGAEILRGKMLGSLRSTAPFGVAVLALWLAGLAVGAIHPFGFLLAMVGAALFVWYATALGTFFSLRSKTTWRAQAWTQSILIAPHLCCYLPLPSPLLMIWVAPLSYSDLRGWWDFSWVYRQPAWLTCLMIAYVVGGIAVYAIAAPMLTLGTFRGFDDVAGRPRPGAGRRKPTAKPSELPEIG